MLPKFWTRTSMQTIGNGCLKGRGESSRAPPVLAATSLTCEYGVLVSRSGPPTKTTIYIVSRARLRRLNQTEGNLPLAFQFVCGPVEGEDHKKPSKQTFVRYGNAIAINIHIFPEQAVKVVVAFQRTVAYDTNVCFDGFLWSSPSACPPICLHPVARGGRKQIGRSV